MQEPICTSWVDYYHGALTNETRTDVARPELMGETKRWNVQSIFGAPLLDEMRKRDFSVTLDDFMRVEEHNDALLVPVKQDVDAYIRYLRQQGCKEDELETARFETVVHNALREDEVRSALMRVCDPRNFGKDSYLMIRNPGGGPPSTYLVPFEVVLQLAFVVKRLSEQSNYACMSGKSMVLELDRFVDTSPEAICGSVELEISYHSDLYLPQPWSVDQQIETHRVVFPRTVHDLFATMNVSKKDDDARKNRV